MKFASESGVGISPVYYLFEMQHAAFQPLRAMAGAAQTFFKTPFNPLSYTPWGRSVAAGCELFERTTRRYGKPDWDIRATLDDGKAIAVDPVVVWTRPFCKLVHFERAVAPSSPHPRMLLVAPMSGHHATLLRGTVEAFLPNHDVYVTDWTDARMVPLADGRFDLEDYVDYIIAMLGFLRGDTHVVAVCQPSVPVLAAVSVMEARDDPFVPLSMTLMSGPIDPRSNPTAVNKLAARKGIGWFRRHAILTVPFPNPGAARQVYPGFLQLTGFLGMNLDRHVGAHRELFTDLVHGDGESARKHREFYDEYLAVMDLTAEFYLQTVETIFIKHALAKGEMRHRGRPVRPHRIRNVALFTVEGEKDDITGLGQTEAAHLLCSAIPSHRRAHYVQPGVGHYGVFNGKRFREEIAPRISRFIRANASRPVRHGWPGDLAAKIVAFVSSAGPLKLPGSAGQLISTPRELPGSPEPANASDVTPTASQTPAQSTVAGDTKERASPRPRRPTPTASPAV